MDLFRATAISLAIFQITQQLASNLSVPLFTMSGIILVVVFTSLH